VQFNFQYVSDTLWGFKSQQTPFASWNRFRATVDIDFGALAGLDGWYFHATGLAQGGGNLGQDLGLLTGPSGLVSANTTRLDSWWIRDYETAVQVLELGWLQCFARYAVDKPEVWFLHPKEERLADRMINDR
jgi:hypothetical protein